MAFSKLKIAATAVDETNTNSNSNSMMSALGKNSSETSNSNDACEESSDDGLSISKLILLSKLKTSRSKTTVSCLPENDELKTVSLMVLYDYIIVRGDETADDPMRVLTCKDAQDIYRTSKLQGDEWPEIRWKLDQLLETI
ncbi:hypothetical protein FOA43_000214 [Brettanomyces nanus]|uniref:Uncharacterized protein n=1 Tax=Eeniella nana TaxID=13502 RepID=A0A875RVH9_EENNA|nr:uncharacterized protein FOA43_000214 [Brettanomyces nanus]QPG72911.1 hypothetical protein FOA43_000214 [Brettanomyces nanus]